MARQTDAGELRARQRRDIVRPFAQRGQPQPDDIQQMHQILTEQPLAHALLEEAGSFGDVWRTIPLKTPIVSRYWRIPAAEVPRDRDELIEWLYEWWARIDAWIAERASARLARQATSHAEPEPHVG